jgi:eukaryotic-like serine/threonine-protein kinase
VSVAGEKLDGEAAGRVGRVLNEKWTLEKLLGVGGMGAVYLGRHRNGAKAAVKVLHSNLAENPDVRERFLREGYAANRVEHRGAVQVLDDELVKEGPDAGAAYLVMELLEGESLEDRAARAPFSEKDFLMVAEGVLDVLEAAHDHGVIHRDLKPDNIFLVRDPDDDRLRVKVLDFGLARLAEREATTQFGLALGTPSYMSPEQASGQRDGIDGRTDIFALGATGFRLLAKRRIQEEENPVRLVLLMSTEPAPPLRSVAPAISERVAAIIDRALGFKPDDRYPTAAAMRADVQAALAATQAASTGMVAAVGPTSTKLATAPAETTAIGPTSAKMPAEPTIALSESDLLPSSPEVVSEIPEAPREPSESYVLPMHRRRSRIPLVTALFCGFLFFADRSWNDAPDAVRETTPPVASDASSLTNLAPEIDAEIEVVEALDAALAPEVPADAALETDAGATDAAPALSAPPRLQALPPATSTATAKHPPPPPPIPPPAKKPPPPPPTKPPPPKKR